MFEEKQINHIAMPSKDCCGFISCQRCFWWESECCQNSWQHQIVHKMETDWHEVLRRENAHQKCGHLCGNLKEAKVSPEFLKGEARSQAEKMRVNPERALGFFNVDGCHQKWWLHIAAEDLHEKNDNGRVLDGNKNAGEKMFPDV